MSFGNALGNSIVRGMMPTNKSGSTTNQQEIQNKAVNQGASDPDNGKFSPFHNDFGDELDAMSQARKPTTYTVKPGDSLGEISEKLYGNAYLFTEIAEANGITDPNYGIKAGQSLVIPGIGAVTDEYKQSLYQQGRSEIGRLGHEALEQIALFDKSSLVNISDWSPNVSNVNELSKWYRRSGQTAEFSYDQHQYANDGLDVQVRTVGINGQNVYSDIYMSGQGSTQSVLGGFNDMWRNWEQSNPYLSEIGGRQSMLGTLYGAYDGLKPSSFAAAAGALRGSSGGGISFYGWNPVSGMGMVRQMNPNPTTTIPAIGRPEMIRPTMANGVKLAWTQGGLSAAAKSGAGIGVILAPVGRAIEYSMDGRDLMSQSFAVDVGLDTIKGATSGAIGAYAGATVAAGVTAGLVSGFTAAGATIGSAAPVLGTVIGAAVGFGIGWGVSALIENGIITEYKLREARFD